MGPVLRVRAQVAGGTGERLGRGCWVWCPGCDKAHMFVIADEDGHIPEGGCWEWDGDLEQPTFSPSYLTWRTTADGEERCHAFVRAGHWEFLADSTHHFAGQTVPMVSLPEWLAAP